MNGLQLTASRVSSVFFGGGSLIRSETAEGDLEEAIVVDPFSLGLRVAWYLVCKEGWRREVKGHSARGAAISACTRTI